MKSKYLLKTAAAFCAAALLMTGCANTETQSGGNDGKSSVSTGGGTSTDGGSESVPAENGTSSDSADTADSSNAEPEKTDEEPKDPLFVCGLLAVNYDGKWGYINNSGEFVIEPQYDGVMPFEKNGIARVGGRNVDKNGNKKRGWGLIDTSGKIILEMEYNEIGEFSHGWATVSTGDGFYSFVNEKGEFIYPIIPETGDDMVITGVETFDKNGLGQFHTYYTKGYFDEKGNIVIEPKYVELGHFADNGLAYASERIGSKYGFIDKKGKYVIEPKFDKAEDFDSSGHARVNIGYEAPSVVDTELVDLPEGKWGVIDERGNYVAEPIYDEIGKFVNGFAKVRQGDKWGFINTDGKCIAEPVFESVESFTENGIAIVSIRNELSDYYETKWGMIDGNGDYIIEPSYDGLSYYKKHDVIFYSNPGSGFRFGIIDKNGNVITDPIFQGGWNASGDNDLISVMTNGKYGFINPKAEMVIEPQFDFAYFFQNGYALVADGDEYGFIDESGKYIFKLQGDAQKAIDKCNKLFFGDDGYAQIYHNGRFGVIDSNGNYVVEPILDDVKVKSNW